MIAREYNCKDCGYHLEEYKTEVRKKCPKCGSEKFHQKLSTAPAVFIKSPRRGK